jgi:hypothetical protein
MKDATMDQVEDRATLEGTEESLDELEGLLRRQLDLVRRGRLAYAETVAKDTDALVLRMVDQGIAETTAFRQRRPKLETLYRSLTLALATTRDDVRRHLELTRRGRKTIATYGGILTRI